MFCGRDELSVHQQEQEQKKSSTEDFCNALFRKEVNMIDIDNIKENQVFYKKAYVGVERVVVISLDTEHKDYIKVQHTGTFDYNGSQICPTYGESYVKVDELFSSLQDAVDCIKKEEKIRFNSYKASIKNLKDLLEFPIVHSFSDCDGVTDGIIVKAYKERVLELTGIEIEY